MERRILLVEDDPLHRDMLTEALVDQNYAVTPTANGQEALDALGGGAFQVALVDIRLPDLNGMELLDHLLTSHSETRVLLMTGQATVEAAVSAMKKGAYDYLAKPFRMELLLLKLMRLFHLYDLEGENRRLKGATTQGGMVANSPKMRQFLATLDTVAGTQATVLLQGESGTGKELAADLLHALSPRNKGPLIKVNCGAIPESLLEAELFGYEKGAFTGADRTRRGVLEQADGGTLFLDEIGEIPHAMQIKLLRVLQDHRVQRLGSEAAVTTDFRLVAATHRGIENLRESGAIRADFYYRLNVITLTLPPLRERKEDIPLLLDHFIRRYSAMHGKSPIRLPAEVLDLLQRHPFPGNVRELQNLVERLQVLQPGGTILPRMLPPEYRRPTENGGEVIQCFRTELSLREALEEFQHRFVERVLQEENGNRTATARRLGISRKNLWEKLAD